MVFIESAVFTRQVRELLTDDEYADLQWHLAQHPRAGDVIPKHRRAAQGALGQRRRR